MKILIGTNNQKKIEEIKSKITNQSIELVNPNEIGLINFDVVEDADTLEGNAFLKAKAFYQVSGVCSISDDTGLFVDFLGGQPGVFSARYAGENASYEENCDKLLDELSISDNRSAFFRTVICLYDGNSPIYFSGECYGEIIKNKKGSKGFGYDPIFLPKNYSITFAEMDSELKNQISHRAKAVSKLIEYLDKLV